MKIFKHCLLFLIFLISSIYPQFGRWNNYHNYSSWKKVLEQIPKPGLKLLVNPALQIGTTTSINSKSLNLKLGNNIVTNGDFHDFTFDATPRAQKNVSTVFIDTVEYVVGTETSPYSNSYVEDGTCWEVEEVSGSPGIDVRMTFIIPDGEVPDSVTIKAYYSGTANRSVYLELWNKTTSTWDSVTTITLDEELDVYTLDLDPNYVFNDTLTMRFYHPDNGNPSYHLCVDYLAITTEIQGVVAYWVFDDIYHAQESTGKTVIQDLSGNGHDLSIGGWTDYNDLLTDMTGTSPIYQGGRALKFPGVSEYLYIPAAQATKFDPGMGDFTVEAWIRQIDATDNKEIFSKYNNSSDVYYRFYIDDGSLRFALRDSLGNFTSTILKSGVGDGQMHHIAFVVNRYTNTVTGFIDGVAGPPKDISNITGSLSSPNGKIYVGSLTGTINFFLGEISAIRYSSKALTEQEIKESYGLAKGWTWDGVGSVSNNNFKQVVSGGGTITQTVATSSGTMYKKSATTNDTTTVSYINEDNYTISLGDGTHDNISVRPVLNAVKPANFVEDFSKGGARYVEITAENQGTQSTSQIYANSTKTNYYWGDGSSAEVIGDFRVINGNHGIMMNNLEDDQPAHPASWKFNGINQYMNFGDILDLKSYDWLFADWVKDDNLASKYFISKYEDANNYWYIGTDASGNIVAKAVDGGTMIWDYVSQTALINDDWNFIAVARVGSNIKMWINGIEVNVTANTAVQSGSVENAGNLYKMRFNTTYSDGYDGIYPIYIFDGQDGAPNDLTESMEKKLIKDIYNITDGLYLQE